MVIHLVSSLHLLQGVTVLIAPAAVNATPVRSIVGWLGGGNWAAGLVLLAAAGAASWLFVAKKGGWGWALPQQVLLLLAASAGMKAAWLGHYADGTEIASAHIFADQVVFSVIALTHLASLFQWAHLCKGCPLVERP